MGMRLHPTIWLLDGYLLAKIILFGLAGLGLLQHEVSVFEMFNKNPVVSRLPWA